MAPSNGPVVSRRAASGQPPVRPVIPALPLPYVRRQASAAAAAPAAPARSPLSDSASGSQDNPGAVKRQPQHTHIQSPASVAPQVVHAGKDIQAASHQHKYADARANGHGPPSVVSSAGKSDAAPVDARDGQDAQIGHDLSKLHFQAAKPSLQMPPNGLPELAATPLGAAAEHRRPTQADGHHPVQAPDSRLPSAISSTSYQMPPPFQPANQPLNIMGNGDVAQCPRPHQQNGHHPLHQSHPSNGSIHFGTFRDSQSSSPGPPLSGGLAPPPGIAGPDGRPPYMTHAANGFPPMMPFGGDVIPMANFDNYGRPSVAYGHMESYPPYGPSFAPSTPHSFHGSQSSGHPEDNGMYGPFPAPVQRNGATAAGDDGLAHNQQRRMFGPPDYPNMQLTMGPPHMMPHNDHGDGIMLYAQQLFASPDFADCTLDLRFPGDSTRSIQIPAHRLILCRSAELAALVRKCLLEPEATKEGASFMIVVEADSQWMRPEAVYMAVQRLYGLPLLQIPSHNRADSNNLVEAGSAREQLEFSLSYAYAGHILGWAPVVRRGCEVAAHLVGWQTMERALEFALEGYRDKGTHDSFRLGDGSRTILNAVGSFIVHNVPPSFNVDLSVDEPKAYARLPVHLPPLSTPPSSSAGAESQASSQPASRNSSVQLGKGRPSQQMAHIQFGDLSLAESRNGVESETPKANKQATPVSHTILSRILLNLPFTNLKMILDSAPGNSTVWANADVRHRVIRRAVEARETRRRRILEAIADGNVAVPGPVRAALRSPTPQDVGRWSSLGWQEEMVACSGPEAVALVRSWVPLRETQNGSSGDYP
ncbi:hypothetical protein HIM_08975 [Hirsutella minnesotensis 3608]|uniref:BTB domain-containing protein n=1 Tax=Hirsutella minnesotensis 3608 TaxID=1043627 RepID=A0A0F7ZSN3_9HYPO|nr:hypothetical protein HIM_08975 [Hirsutella minnesotensis 3608]